MNQKRIRDAELYSRIRQGDGSAVNALIEAWYGMVVRRAETYATRRPGARLELDDLIGGALLAVVEAVNKWRLPHQEIASVRSYLNKVISRSLRDTAATRKVATSRTPTAPPGTVQKREYRQKKRDLAAGGSPERCDKPANTDRCVCCEQVTRDFYRTDPRTNTIVARGVICASCYEDLLRQYTRGKSLPKLKDVDQLKRLTEADGQRLAELRDAIDGCCETDLERDYVRVQSEAYPSHLNDEQVGEALGISDTKVWRTRKAIELRYRGFEIGQGA